MWVCRCSVGSKADLHVGVVVGELGVGQVLAGRVLAGGGQREAEPEGAEGEVEFQQGVPRLVLLAACQLVALGRRCGVTWRGGMRNRPG
jgi:hypothetical protein